MFVCFGQGKDEERGPGVGEGNRCRVEAAVPAWPPKLCGGRVFLAHCYGVWAERRSGARPLRLRVVSPRGWQSLRAETTVWSCWQFNCFCCSLLRLRKRQEGQNIPHCDSVCGQSLLTKSVKGFFGTINLSSGF